MINGINSFYLFCVTLFLHIAALFLFLPSTTSAATITMPPNNLGLVGYWSFEDATSTIATDFSGNRNHGTLTNMTNADWVNGKIGKALDFDGTDDYVTVASNSSLRPSSTITISAWVKITSQPGTNGYQSIIYNDTGSNNANYQITYRDVSGDKRVYAGVRQSNGTYIYHDISQVLTSGAWYHIVLVANGSNLLVYLNGVEIGSPVPYDGTIRTDIGSLIFGATESATLPLPGSLDDIRIYSRALSVTEIGKLYSNPKKITLQSSSNQIFQESAVGMWSFGGKDVSGSTIYDRSGNNNNGQLYNGAYKTYSKIGQAIGFDGVDDYISIANSSSNTFDRTLPFSMTIFAQTFTDGVDQVLFSKYSSPGGGNEYGYRLSITSENKIKFEFSGGDSTNRIVVTTNTAISTNILHDMNMYSVTYDGTSDASGINIYLNGNSQEFTASVNGLTGDTTTNSPNFITGTFFGKCYGVYIHNIVVAPRRIRQWWQNTGISVTYQANAYTAPVVITEGARYLFNGNLVDSFVFGNDLGGFDGSSGNTAYTYGSGDNPEGLYYLQVYTTENNPQTFAVWKTGITHNDFEFTENGDFSIDVYSKCTTFTHLHPSGGENCSITYRDQSENRTLWSISFNNASGYLKFNFNGTEYAFSDLSQAIDTWTQWKIERRSGVLRAAKGGTTSATTYNITSANTPVDGGDGQFVIGTFYKGSHSLDDLRIIKNVAIHNL